MERLTSETATLELQTIPGLQAEIAYLEEEVAPLREECYDCKAKEESLLREEEEAEDYEAEWCGP